MCRAVQIVNVHYCAVMKDQRINTSLIQICLDHIEREFSPGTDVSALEVKNHSSPLCHPSTARCHALKFQPSKSHKKVLKKMSKFISKGELPKDEVEGEPMDSACGNAGHVEPRMDGHCAMSCAEISNIQTEIAELPVKTNETTNDAESSPAATDSQRNESESDSCKRTAAAPKPGVGVDPNRPVCRKAKDLRKERRQQKEQMRQQTAGVASGGSSTSAPSNQPKSLEEFIKASFPENSSHSLEVRLVRSNPPCTQFKASFDASYQVYKLYQMAIHKDPPDKPSESQFRRFLCDSPLEAESPPDAPEMGYGSFHQQYWLDGRIIAVGVIDILPTCVSSVYLYYHPDFSALSLGSYSALREISFTRELQKQSPKLSYYYLGFYIHSCPKMRYKGQYRPSDLLCPETFIWVPIERCLPQLENTRYARFNQDLDAGDAHAMKDVGRAMVLHRRAAMPYAAYLRKRKGSSDEVEVKQYASLVGQTCAERILLYRA